MMNRTTLWMLVFGIFGSVPIIGCDQMMVAGLRAVISAHERYIGDAAEYFPDDPRVVELCEAIEAKDLGKVRLLIAERVDVNACGKDNMTPLMWAFPGDNAEIFRTLLEAGANPNVKVINTVITGIIDPGDSVTCLTAKTDKPGYFEWVMKHGGNAKLLHPSILDTPVTLLHTILQNPRCPDRKTAVRLLLEGGVDVNRIDDCSDCTALSMVWGDFELGRMLLEHGADPEIPGKQNGQTASCTMLKCYHAFSKDMTAQQKREYEQYIAVMEAHGADMKSAEQDLRELESGVWKGKMDEFVRKVQKRYEQKKAEREKKNDAP